MERRHLNRTRVSFKSELIARHMRYSGLIENLSENNLCMSIKPPKTPLTIPEGMTFIVKFEGSRGDTHELQCKVVRPYKISPGKPVTDVGMEIIKRPQEYLDFLKTLKK
ncbi:MAG: hypothetical protein EHM54_11305 [Nitrospiraceae bacterium]|nr:MAG: hypothetical protein EHM54_11305 [Nitrospiraceae bacterium]